MATLSNENIGFFYCVELAIIVLQKAWKFYCNTNGGLTERGKKLNLFRYTQ